MFSLKRSYKWCRNRIDDLQKTVRTDEAFVLTMFFVEKIIRRTLLQLIIRTGRSKTDAVESVKKLMGIWAVKKAWKNYDPKNRDLEIVIGQPNWETIKGSACLRNVLIHGSGNEDQRLYKRKLPALIQTLDDISGIFSREYHYSGWKGMKDNAGNLV